MKRAQYARPKRPFGKRLLILFIVAALLITAVVAFARMREADRRREIANAGLPIQPVYQYDYPEAVCCISGVDKSVATSGCGATCVSMVVSYFTDDAAQTPQTLFERAYQNGDYSGYGLTHEALTRLAQSFGIESVWIDRDESRIRAALQDGYPVVAHMGPGTFTQEGHYILLRGLLDDGRVILNDPNSERRTYTAYDLADVISQTKGESPFMICRLQN